jgi:hypothetical protein
MMKLLYFQIQATEVWANSKTFIKKSGRRPLDLL